MTWREALIRCTTLLILVWLIEHFAPASWQVNLVTGAALGILVVRVRE